MQQKDNIQKYILSMVMLNAFTTPLMLSATNVALPSLATDLGLGAVLLSWVPLAYLMASAMLVLIFGRLADMLGRKKVFLTGTFGVVLTSLMAAYAINGETLLIARFLQGCCAAMLYATQMALVTSVYPPKQRGKVIGYVVAMIYLGLSCGPLFGGFLIDYFDWRMAFLFHIPLAVVVLLVGIFLIKGEWNADDAGSFDIKGAILYPLIILLFCFGVSLLPDKRALILIMLAIFGLIIFIKTEHNQSSPLLNVELFYSNRIFTFSCVASLLLYTATFSNVVLVSLYLQYLKGFSAAFAGLVMMIQPLTMAAFSPVTGSLSDRLEPRYLATAGVVVTASGLFLLSSLSQSSSTQFLLLALFMTGFGFALFSSPNVNAIMSTVKKQELGVANGVVALMRILGQLGSMAIVALIFALQMGHVEIDKHNLPELEIAMQNIYLLAALICLPAIFFSFNRGSLRT